MALEAAEGPATIQSQQLWRVPEYGTRISRAYPAHILARSVDSLAAFPAYPARSGDGLAAFPAFPARSADRLLCICRLVVWPLLARRGDTKPSQPVFFCYCFQTHPGSRKHILFLYFPKPWNCNKQKSEFYIFALHIQVNSRFTVKSCTFYYQGT